MSVERIKWTPAGDPLFEGLPCHIFRLENDYCAFWVIATSPEHANEVYSDSYHCEEDGSAWTSVTQLEDEAELTLAQPFLEDVEPETRTCREWMRGMKAPWVIGEVWEK